MNKQTDPQIDGKKTDWWVPCTSLPGLKILVVMNFYQQDDNQHSDKIILRKICNRNKSSCCAWKCVQW